MDISRIIFDLSPDQYRLENLGYVQDGKGENLGERKDFCLSLLTFSLLANGLASLLDLETPPMELVSGIHNVPFCGCYLPSSMVEVLISVKKYLKLACTYPGIPPVVDMKRATLEQYISSWTSAKKKVLLTCEDKITFDGSYESWPVFFI